MRQHLKKKISIHGIIDSMAMMKYVCLAFGIISIEFLTQVDDRAYLARFHSKREGRATIQMKGYCKSVQTKLPEETFAYFVRILPKQGALFSRKHLFQSFYLRVNFELKYFLKYFECITIAPLLITIHHAKEVPNRLSMLNKHAKFTTKVQMPIYSRRK